MEIHRECEFVFLGEDIVVVIVSDTNLSGGNTLCGG